MNQKETAMKETEREGKTKGPEQPSPSCCECASEGTSSSSWGVTSHWGQRIANTDYRRHEGRNSEANQNQITTNPNNVCGWRKPRCELNNENEKDYWVNLWRGRANNIRLSPNKDWVRSVIVHFWQLGCNERNWSNNTSIAPNEKTNPTLLRPNNWLSNYKLIRFK